MLWERADGVKGIGQIEGDIRNIPLCLRGKRNADAFEGEDNNNREEAAVLDEQDAVRYRKKTKRATTGKKASAPRKKKATAAAAAVPADAAAEAAAPPAPARAAGTRRSSRVSAAAGANRNVFQNDPIPEEEEYHPVVKDEGDELADFLNDFEIASNAGTGELCVLGLRKHSMLTLSLVQSPPVSTRESILEPCRTMSQSHQLPDYPRASALRHWEKGWGDDTSASHRAASDTQRIRRAQP